MRRTAFAQVRPFAQSRSLTACCILSSDPTWRAATAPVLRWGKEVRLAQARLFAGSLSLAELRDAWPAVWARAKTTWATSSGPISAMRLAFLRLGWQMPDFLTIIDDRGYSIELGVTSPALLAIHCREALLRSLERDLGEKWDAGARLCLDVPKAALSSKGFSASEQGMIRALACNAIWTPDRAIACGYIISDVCVHCGGKDSLHHRLWVCPHCAEERAEVAEASVIASALDTEAENYSANLFCHGAFAHPADFLPRPCKDGAVQFVWHKDVLVGPQGPEEPREGDVWGHLFLDGSCNRHIINELSRAAWAITMHDDAGVLLYEVRGPVWAQYPQTPQAGEFLARGMAGTLAKYDSVLYSDCLNVVKHSNLPLPDRLSGKRVYSGIIMEANAREGSKIGDVIKVKAHQDLEEAGLSDQEIFLS